MLNTEAIIFGVELYAELGKGIQEMMELGRSVTHLTKKNKESGRCKKKKRKEKKNFMYIFKINAFRIISFD